jgi:hypothetical protein
VNYQRCDDCGQRYTVGDWPYCPHGKPYGMMTFVPYFDEHICEEGAWVTSLAQRRRLMKENNFDYRGLKVGMPRCEV